MEAQEYIKKQLKEFHKDNPNIGIRYEVKDVDASVKESCGYDFNHAIEFITDNYYIVQSFAIELEQYVYDNYATDYISYIRVDSLDRVNNPILTLNSITTND